MEHEHIWGTDNLSDTYETICLVCQAVKEETVDELCDNCAGNPATHGADGVDDTLVMLCDPCVAELQKVGSLNNVEVK
jgi:hypothetical protein